jgi:hypothetical protein
MKLRALTEKPSLGLRSLDFSTAGGPMHSQNFARKTNAIRPEGAA